MPSPPQQPGIMESSLPPTAPPALLPTAQQGLGADHKVRLELNPCHSPSLLHSVLHAAVTICFSKAKESTASKPCYCLSLCAQLIASASQLSLLLAAKSIDRNEGVSSGRPQPNQTPPRHFSHLLQVYCSLLPLQQ